MRIAATAAALVLLLAGTAAAQTEPSPCQFTGGPNQDSESNRIIMLAQPVAAEAEAWLGEQFAKFWGQPRDGGWYVGVAPGSVEIEAARRYILERVDARYDGDDEARLGERLRVVEQPYGLPDLRRIQAEMSARWQQRSWRVGSTMGVGCTFSDAWRMQFELFSDAGREAVADAQALAAEYGDRVRFRHSADISPPTPGAGAAPAAPTRTLRPVDVVRFVHSGRCRSARAVRVGVRPRHREAANLVEIRSARTTLRGARLIPGARLSIPRRGARIRVRVRFADGRAGSTTHRVRACGR